MLNGKYGAERNLVCKTCGRDNLGRTDLHHIIDQAFIKKRAKRWQLEYLANGILSNEYMEDMKDSDIINVLVNKNPRNITEMCQTCHKMTNSYQQFLDSRNKASKTKKSKIRKRTNRKDELLSIDSFLLVFVLKSILFPSQP